MDIKVIEFVFNIKSMVVSITSTIHCTNNKSQISFNLTIILVLLNVKSLMKLLSKWL